MVKHLVLCLAVLALASAAFAADYVMQSGDTLYDLAKSHYGDPNLWTALKWYNGLGNEYKIPVGTPINFPDKAKLDQVNQILQQNPSASARAQAISALGGQNNVVPQATPNAGLGGKKVFYYGLWSLKKPGVPSR